MPRLDRWLVTATLLLAVPALPAQQPPASADATHPVRLFLDCAASGCDFDYLRTRVTWVDYVRDPAAADVHVIITALSTGGGGSEITLKFAGRQRFLGMDDEFRYALPQGTTSDERRAELVRVLSLGLARYAVRLSGGKGLAIGYTVPTAIAAVASHDPWKRWVFSLGISGYVSGESSATSSDVSGNLSAARVTAEWKFELGLSGNSSNNRFSLGDGTVYRASVHSYYLSGKLVRSLTDHLSVGASFGGSSSSQDNIDLYTRVAPTIEYDFFPYAEYTRRQLLLQYSVGLNRYDYTETTIFDRDRETRLRQRLSLDYSTRTTWGSASIGVAGGAYLSDIRQNRLSVDANMNIRIVQGLSLNYGGSYARVRDQITLPRDGASDEEILLRLRRLRTNYQYSTYFGLNYTFGSVFNNVVNPRMNYLDR
ncbi:MAG: hypothetical protein SFU84_02625 [Gemmatimonadales bacterium]|nr:hypothetical protein [Gemmatimonadales bacterium]